MNEKNLAAVIKPKTEWDIRKKYIVKHWQLYLLVLPPIIWIIIFRYVPLFGIQIAFRDYTFVGGITGSPWVGLTHFRALFGTHQFNRLLVNTLALSVYSIAAGFIPPILLALGLNYCRMKYFGKTVQMVTYMPYFISGVLIVGMMNQLLALNGPVNQVLTSMGFDRMFFMGDPGLFRSVFVWSGVWQNNGYNAIIYLAALAAVNPELYEAATVDGASAVRRIWHIDLPSLLPTATILFILAFGNIMSVGAERVLLMQNTMNISTSDVFSTFVFRIGLLHMQFSFTTAVGLFESVVSVFLLLAVNAFSRKVSETSLW